MNWSNGCRSQIPIQCTDDFFDRTFAARVRVACSAYADAGKSEVTSHVNPGMPLIVAPRHEYLHCVPRLLQVFLECLENKRLVYFGCTSSRISSCETGLQHWCRGASMDVLEVKWVASMEREGLSDLLPSEDSNEIFLSEMRKQQNGGHKTCVPWMEFQLGDGVAYLALHVTIRMGYVEIRETPIRHFAPKVMGYGKNK